MQQVRGVLLMNFLEMFQFLVLLIVRRLMLIIPRIIFLVLSQGPLADINGSFGTFEKSLV